MCLLIVGFRSHRNFPIYLAANREEEIKRKTTPPKILDNGNIIVAGVDEREGGTWLGANQFNIAVAVTNRSDKGTAGKKRSRGQLVVEALRQESPEQIQKLVKKNAKFYKPFNLFYGDMIAAYITSWNGKRLSTEKLDPGVHVISTGNLNDAKSPKVKRVLELIKKSQETAMPQDVLPLDWRDLFFQLIQILKDHEPEKDQKETICRHDKPVKTVASTIFALANRGVQLSYFWHLIGNPCSATYRDYSHLAKKIVTPVKSSGETPSV